MSIAVQWAGADVTSIERAGRITTFGFAIGAGLLIASGASAAVAAAAPDDSGSTSGSSASSSTTARSARPSSSAVSKPKPARSVVTGTDFSAPVMQLHTKRTTKPVSAASVTAPAATVSATTTAPASARQAPARRLPTPAEVQQNIMAGLDAARRNLDTLRQNIELLVRHQIEGIRDNLRTLRDDLAGIIGPNRPPVNPDIPADETPGVIGRPNTLKNYFLYQGQTNRCVLMSTAMVIGQLLGQDKMPTAQEITDEAATTPSTVTPGTNIYDPVADTYVKYADALALLEKHGITATSTQYSKNQGAAAINDVKAALTAGDSVIVTVNADIAWGRAAPGGIVSANHAITVLGIDTAKNIVYVNDSAFRNGKGIAMDMDVFMSSWRANDYQTITAYVTPAANASIAA